jgi:hypothetical protein
MTKVGLLMAALFVFVLSTLLAVTSETVQRDAAPLEPPQITKAQADRWMTELSNWGRWGKDISSAR